ncbi:hypothetical protein [Cohnella luojiensis]|uniref:Uncharacterized protein n=1 Tax=Cohnella luojiensis TaxID=652876 RepID=A0A4Y8LN06_9BACL|nr:hypothetical protein [Cohnella luojiensis]TFE19389.1 hypothetical protein E2980_23395 [Cohnella luojiensis]
MTMEVILVYEFKNENDLSSERSEIYKKFLKKGNPEEGAEELIKGNIYVLFSKHSKSPVNRKLNEIVNSL